MPGNRNPNNPTSPAPAVVAPSIRPGTRPIPTTPGVGSTGRPSQRPNDSVTGRPGTEKRPDRLMDRLNNPVRPTTPGANPTRPLVTNPANPSLPPGRAPDVADRNRVSSGNFAHRYSQRPSNSVRSVHHVGNVVNNANLVNAFQVRRPVVNNVNRANVNFNGAGGRYSGYAGYGTGFARGGHRGYYYPGPVQYSPFLRRYSGFYYNRPVVLPAYNGFFGYNPVVVSGGYGVGSYGFNYGWRTSNVWSSLLGFGLGFGLGRYAFPYYAYQPAITYISTPVATAPYVVTSGYSTTPITMEPPTLATTVGAPGITPAIPSDQAPPPNEQAPNPASPAAPAPGAEANVVPAPVAQSSDSSSAEDQDFAGLGEAAFKRGEYKPAARAFRHALVDDPQNGTLVLLLAQALFADANFDEAAGAVQQALLMLPPDQWGVVVKNYTDLYPNIGSYADQLKVLEKARTEKPEAPALRLLLGYHYGYLGYPDQATKELDKLIALAPKDELAKKLRDQLKNPSKPASPAPETKGN